MKTETGIIIQQLREELKLSREEFAMQLGITKEYVYLIETSRVPSRHIVVDIAGIYVNKSKKSAEDRDQIIRSLWKEVLKNYKQSLLKAVNRKVSQYAQRSQ